MRGLRLDIDGRKGGNRYLVQVNDRAVYLPASQFIILAVLALERRRKGGDGWVDAKALVPQRPRNAARYVYLLRGSIADGLAGTRLARWKVVKATARGRFRLLLEDPDAIRFTNLPALVDMQEPEITRRLRGKLRVL